MRITRVLLVQNHLEELGGVTRFCALLGAGLESRGYEVEIGSISPPVNREEGAYPAAWKKWTLTDQLSPHARTRGRKGGLLTKSKLRREILRFNESIVLAANEYFQSVGPETVVIFTQLYARERVGAIANVEHRYGRFHLVGMYHNSHLGGRRVGDIRRVLRSFGEADQFLALTREDARLFQQSGMNNSWFIQNPMLPLNEIRYPIESRRVVSLGRYDRQKSLEHLIEAWSLLGDETAGWHLDLYGEGPRRDSLSLEISKLGLTNVHLQGTTTDAIEVISNAAFTVQSSQYEGQPLALMEAAALGVPSVAYNCAPGVAEIIEDDVDGYLATPNDPYALSYGMRRLIRSEELRVQMGSAARRNVRAKFDLETVLDRWESLFVELEGNGFDARPFSEVAEVNL